MGKLPKDIIRKYGISKKAWQVYRNRKRSSTTRRKPTRRKPTMARRRRNPRRRRRTKKKLPLLTTLAFGASQMSNLGIGSIDSQGPIGGFMKHHNLEYLFNDEMRMFLGYDPPTGSWNPLAAKGTITLLAASIAGSVLNRFVGRKVSQIPIIGNYIKF